MAPIYLGLMAIMLWLTCSALRFDTGTNLSSADTPALLHTIPPTYLIPVTEAQPNHAFGPINAAFIFKVPGANREIAMEVAFSLPDDITNPSYCEIGFGKKFQDPTWLRAVEGNNKFSIYAFATDICSIFPEDTWDNHTAVDKAGGLIAQVLVNSTGTYIESSISESTGINKPLGKMHHICNGKLYVELWMEATGEDSCNFGWVQEQYEGIVLKVYGRNPTVPE